MAASYGSIFDVLNGGPRKEFIADQPDDLTVDQRIAAAQVVALAAIVEELSKISEHGIAQSGQIQPGPGRSAYEGDGITTYRW